MRAVMQLLEQSGDWSMLANDWSAVPQETGLGRECKLI